MGGIFTTILNVVGAATVGVPLGTVAASQAQPGYAPITQTPAQIAATVAPKVQAAIANPAKTGSVTSLSQAVATAAAPQIAQQLAAGGYMFPAGTQGAELQHPNLFDAFGGSNARLAEIGFAALGVLLLIKAVKK
jgi:hypothetical protein